MVLEQIANLSIECPSVSGFESQSFRQLDNI